MIFNIIELFTNMPQAGIEPAQVKYHGFLDHSVFQFGTAAINLSIYCSINSKAMLLDTAALNLSIQCSTSLRLHLKILRHQELSL